MTIRLVVADDHPLILRGIEAILNSEPDCEVVACCSNGKELLEAVRRHKPGVVILDSRMPGTNSLEIIRILTRDPVAPRVVLHAESSEEPLIREAVRLGIRGVFLKEMAPSMLVQCVRRVYGGEYWLEWRSASQVLEELLRQEQGARDLAQLLTPREQEILHLLCRGLRNKEIGKSVSIAESTVKVHVRHIYEKLHVNGRMALLRLAEDKGLLRSIRS